MRLTCALKRYFTVNAIGQLRRKKNYLFNVSISEFQNQSNEEGKESFFLGELQHSGLGLGPGYSSRLIFRSLVLL